MAMQQTIVTAGTVAFVAAVVLAYFAAVERESTYYRYWAAGFLLQSVRQGFSYLSYGGWPAGEQLGDICFIVSTLLLALGAMGLLGWRRRQAIAVGVATAAILWIAGAAALGVEFTVRTLPAYSVIGIGTFVTAVALWRRHRRDPAAGYHILAALFALWAIHILNYPLLVPAEAYAPYRIPVVATLIGVMALFFVVTAQRRAEIELRRSEQRLRVAVGAADLSVFAQDRGLKYTWTFNQQFGNRAELVLGKTDDELLAADSARDITAIKRHVLDTGVAERHEVAVVAGGRRMILDLVVEPLHGHDGRILGLVGAATDVTRHRATEEQLRHAQKLEAIGQLTGGVAHDFNNLLAVISGSLELVESRLAGRDDLGDLMRMAMRAVDRGAALTRSLLAFARRQPLSPSLVDVNVVAREMSALLRRTMPENCEIELVCAGGLWPCEVDPGQLQNALVNLVVNACDAMPQGGKITIETANAHLDGAYAAAHIEVDPGQYVMLAVSDTGPGMTEEVMARAFEPFFTTKRAGAGSGLGLSMVYGFTKQSRGHIKLYSELGHGTTVKIYLPRGQAKPATDVAAETAVEKADEEETVLLVEDDADVRALAAEQLKSLGYQVLEAPNADAALAIIREGKPIALLFTDVVLPGGMNGRALADQVKHILPQMKVLYMSGYTENAIIHHGRLDPGVFLLQKPFRRHDLAAKVRAAIVGARR